MITLIRAHIPHRTPEVTGLITARAGRVGGGQTVNIRVGVGVGEVIGMRECSFREVATKQTHRKMTQSRVIDKYFKKRN